MHSVLFHPRTLWFVAGAVLALAPAGARAAPPPTITSQPPAVTNATTASFAFAGVDGAVFTCSVDGAEFTDCASPVTLGSLADGAHSFGVKQRGQGDDVPSDPVTATWTIDTRPPAAPTITGTPAPSSEETDAFFTFSGEPGAAESCSLDSGAWSACAEDIALSGLSVGQHTFSVRDTDAAGNTGPAAAYTWSVLAPATHTTTFGIDIGTNLLAEDSPLPVGCAIDTGSLYSCEAWVSLDFGQGRRARAATLADGSGVIAHGRITLGRRGVSAATVPAAFNAAGRALLAHHLFGLSVRVEVLAHIYDDAPRRDMTLRVISASTVRVGPGFPAFRGRSDVIGRRLRRYLEAFVHEAPPLTGVTCSAAASSHRLALRRARAVCVELRRLGLRARLDAVAGHGAPGHLQLEVHRSTYS